MKFLLDTHIAIWAVAEPHRIPAHIAGSLADAAGAVAVSAVSIWEIAIKHRLGRPDSPPFSGHEAIVNFDNAGFSLLDVTAAHAALVERLPPIHSDPFDRLILAQAIFHGLQLVTYDSHLLRYDLAVLSWQ